MTRLLLSHNKLMVSAAMIGLWAAGVRAAEQSVELSPTQVNAIQIGPVGTHPFDVQIEALGTISFSDERSVQVFPPYQGRILQTFAELGDDVQKGQPLYTIDSPDLVQAESTLISAAATFDLTRKELERARELSDTNGVSARELEQAASDEQTAQGAFNAAHSALHIFGKTDDEIARILSTRKVDAGLIVRSPMTGHITAMEAPPGLMVQPGTLPAPYAVADVSIKWLLASVPEDNSAALRTGQPVEARFDALPGQIFKGAISKIYPNVDPTTHRVTVRSDINDPNQALRPGMMATFAIQLQPPAISTALPANGVVRNGDGTMAAWVTTDRKHFVERIIKVGLRSDDGFCQILDGLRPGELAVTDGAVFLSNMLEAPPTD